MLDIYIFPSLSPKCFLSSYANSFLWCFVAKWVSTSCWYWYHWYQIHLVVSVFLLPFIDISGLAGMSCVFGVSAYIVEVCEYLGKIWCGWFIGLVISYTVRRVISSILGWYGWKYFVMYLYWGYQGYVVWLGGRYVKVFVGVRGIWLRCNLGYFIFVVTVVISDYCPWS